MANSEEKLRRLLETIAKEQNYTQANITIKGITSDGANYTTDLYLATISEPPKPDLNMFAKVANLNEKIREHNKMLANVYVVESAFYTKLAVNFERLYEKNNVTAEHRLVVPKFFGQNLTEFEETMVLENLEMKGYQNFDRMKTFNWEYAATAVQQMARFHALGIALRDENPTEFNKIISSIEVDMSDGENAWEEFMDQAIQNACSSGSKEHAERLQKYLESGVTKKMMTRFFTDKAMLVHGDFRQSNLMHRRGDRKLEIIPLDYQTLRLGNPVADLMHFIFSGSDEEFRRLHYRRLLDHYHAELTIALRHLQLDAEKMYPKKTFEQDVLNTQPLGLMLGLAMVALITVYPEDAPKFEEKVEDLALKPNPVGQERINGIINDFVRWGII